jgi:hypothetical protein
MKGKGFFWHRLGARSQYLTLAKNCSIGLRSDEYFGR